MKTPLLAYVAAVSCVLPAAAGVYHWKKFNAPVKILTMFFCYSLLNVGGEEVLRRMHLNNLFLGNIHQLIEIQCYLYLYWAWSTNRILKDTIQYGGLFYLVFWIVNQLYFVDPQKLDEIIATIANFVLIVISVLMLHELTRKATTPLPTYLIFWIAAGVIVYCAGTIIILSFSNSIIAMGYSYFIAFWHINWILTIIVNTMFARSFWCKI